MTRPSSIRPSARNVSARILNFLELIFWDDPNLPPTQKSFPEMVKSCAVVSCKNYKRFANTNSEKIVSFHRFPLKKKNLLDQWVAATGRSGWTATSSHSICSDHFARRDFLTFDSKKRYLFPYSVPSLNLDPANTLQKPLVLDISSDDSDSNDESLSFDCQPEQISTNKSNDAHKNVQENSSIGVPQHICESPPVECETGPVVEVVSENVFVEKLNWTPQPAENDVPSIELHSEDSITCDQSPKINEPRPINESLVVISLKRKLQTQIYRNVLMRKKYKAVQSINIRQKRKICALEEKILCLKKALSKDNQNFQFD